jgi:hypothetical protein
MNIKKVCHKLRAAILYEHGKKRGKIEGDLTKIHLLQKTKGV